MKEKSANLRLLKILGWSLLSAFLLTLILTAVSSMQIVPGLDSRVVFAQEGPGHGKPGQGYCPDGVTSVPAGVPKGKWCKDNGQFPPGPPDFVEDLWCRLAARFRMFIPFGHRYDVTCLEEGPPLPPGIREADFRIVTVIRDSDGQVVKQHSPPLLWKLLNARDFSNPGETVVLLRWNEDIEPNKWDFVPGQVNEDGTIDYLVSNTSLFAVGISDDPDALQAFIAPETVIPAGLPRTGLATSSPPWGAGVLVVTGLAVITAVGLWRWRGS